MTQRPKNTGRVPFFAYIVSGILASLIGIIMYSVLFEEATDENITKSNADIMPFVLDVTKTVNRLAKQDELRAEDAATMLALEKRGRALERNQNDDDYASSFFPYDYRDLLDGVEQLQQPDEPLTAYDKARAVAELKDASDDLIKETAQALEDDLTFWHGARVVGTPIGIIIVLSIFFGVPEFFRDEDN